MTGINIWQLIVIFLILLLLFGSKKIRTLGKDLGDSIKGFKDSMENSTDEKNLTNIETQKNAVEPSDSESNKTSTVTKKN